MYGCKHGAPTPVIMAGSHRRFFGMSSPSRDCDSDGDGDGEVETIVEQAMDLCTLRQIAQLNSAAHLVSVPVPQPESLPLFPPTSRSASTPSSPTLTCPVKEEPPTSAHPTHTTTSPMRLRGSTRTSGGTSPPPPPHPPAPLGEEYQMQRQRRELSPSPSPSPSPPKPVCCFGCSPHTSKKNKGKGEMGAAAAIDDEDEYWRVNREMLSDLKTFSLREQRRKLKVVLKEQERASREADKLLELVRRASARMEVATTIDELLTSSGDDDDDDADANDHNAACKDLRP